MVEVFIDGACRGNGATKLDRDGHAAIGIAVYKNRKLAGHFCRGLGKRTSNEAEYEALIHALLWCWTLSSSDAAFRNPTIYSDSLIVVNQVNGIWRCKSPTLIPLLATVSKFVEANYEFELKHVRRRDVWEADALANLFLDDILFTGPAQT